MRGLIFVFLSALMLPACATITTGTNHSLSVVTDPPGAACELRRGGDVVGIVNPTPGTVRIDKSYRDISIECNRPGNVRGSTTVSAGFQPMFVGNLLIGGLIGMGVDIISAAGATYPNTAYVILQRGDALDPPIGTPATAPAVVASAPMTAASPAPAQSPAPMAAAIARDAVSSIPASMTLQQYVEAARADCRRQRGRNCDAAAEAAAVEFENAWQARRGRGGTT